MSGDRVAVGGRILVATRNPGKLHELRPLFAGLGLEVVDLATAGVPESPDEDAVEAFETFEENALAKARYYYRAGGGLPTVADDSGLEVLALDGRPGVRSKRFSGADGDARAVEAANNAKLLRLLEGVADRRARFVCAVAYVDASGELVVRGEAPGHILEGARGSHGFGYDPLFLSDELGTTYAEADREAKASVSHRGRAFQALVRALTSR